jgi:hypothetical protein
MGRLIMPRTADPNRPRCIVCGKPIAKRFGALWFQRSTDGSPASPFASATTPKPDGTRINQTLYLDHPPTTKDEAARYVNQPIQRIIGMHNGYISGVTTWDGESYIDRFFCRDKCAVRQGYASAHHGDRFTWKDG